MSIQEQTQALQSPNSFLLPPSVSDTENDVLNYNNLTTSPVVTVQPWIGINSQSSLWLHCECTYADGSPGIIKLAESVAAGTSTVTSAFTYELPIDVLSTLGDNTTLTLILMVSNDGTTDKESLSVIRYNLMFQHPIALINYSRWMTDIGTSLEHLKIRDLILPETHHAGIDQEGAGWPADQWAACQDDSFAYQLNNGIRALDLRMEYSSKRGYRFEHSGYHADRLLSHCVDAVADFAGQNPGEIVILDFQKVSNDVPVEESIKKRALFEVLVKLGNRCIPAVARDLTIKQIHDRYPGKNIVIAWNLPDPICWPKVNQTWTGNDLNSSNALSRHIQEKLGARRTDLWSMFACGYDVLGPMRLRPEEHLWKIFFDGVKSDRYRQPARGNMILVDFFAGARIVDRCINATRERASNAARTVASGLTATKTGNHDVRLNWWSPQETENLSGFTIVQNGAYLAAVPSHTREYSITGLADGRTYHFQVFSDFLDGEGAATEATVTIPDITSPSRPYNLRTKTLAIPNHPVFYLEWEKSTDNVALRHYEIYRNYEPRPIGTTNYSYFEINETTGVTYVVRAVDTSGNYSDSEPLSASGDETPPSTPANLVATATNYNTVTLTWDPSSDNDAVAGYEIFRNNGRIGSVDNTIFSETVSDGTYTYKVRALDRSGNSSTDSNEATLKIGRPSKPTGVSAMALSGKTYITWQGSPGNVGFFYEIYRNTVPLGKVHHHHSGTQAFMTEDVVTPWSIVVRAWNYAGDYVDSDPAIGEGIPSDTTAPSKPTNLRATHLTGNSATLEWVASSDNVAVTGYRILCNNDPIDTTNFTQYIARGLIQGTAYTFKVLALDAAGNISEPAAVAVTTPVSSAPTRLQFNRISNQYGSIQWEPPIASGGVTGYQLSRDGHVIRESSERSFIFTDLMGGITYLFEVRAIRDGKYSDPASIRG